MLALLARAAHGLAADIKGQFGDVQGAAEHARMARELDDYSTPDFLSAEITCRACRSPVPTMPGTSPRGSSPRETTAHCWPVVASRLCALYPQPRAGDVGGACWVERVAWTSRGFGNVQQVENGLYNLVKY